MCCVGEQHSGTDSIMIMYCVVQVKGELHSGTDSIMIMYCVVQVNSTVGQTVL